MAKTVLIIDDDKFFQSMYRQAFEGLGFQVLVADDGVKGLEQIKQAKPNAVLLDLIMPNMGGFDVLKHCKDDVVCSTIPVVVLSGVASEQEIDQAKQLGAVHSFSKLVYLPATIAEYIETGLKEGFDTDEKMPQSVRIATLKEGEVLNDIFREAAEKTHVALSQMFNKRVKIGNLQATMAPASNLKKYLNEVAVTFPDEVVVYSVLKPPFAAGLLSLKSDFVLKLTNVMSTKMRGTVNQQENINESVKELYNIVSNAFLNILTQNLNSTETFLFRVPMLSTPDLALNLLRRDGFDLNANNIQFVFRQSYIFESEEEESKEEEFNLELILIFSAEGISNLSKVN